MTRLTIDDILPNADFAAQRQRMMSHVLQAKKTRTLMLGDAMVFLFENYDTMRWQVHEMCRVENITKPDGVAHEVLTYGALVTTPDSLSATLLIQYDQPEVRDRRLRELLGLHNHMRLEVEGCATVPVQLDAGQYNDERISSVQFVRIPVTADHRAALADLSKTARLVCDHPHYTTEMALPGTLRAALVADTAKG